MTSRKELLQAINTIVNYCHSQDDCELCPFFVIGFGCMFADSEAIPAEWDTRKLEGQHEEENS